MKKGLSLILFAVMFFGTAICSAETYTVKDGDCLSKIAKAKGVGLQSLIQANNIKKPDYITVGQKLNIPEKEAAGQKAQKSQVMEKVEAEASSVPATATASGSVPNAAAPPSVKSERVIMFNNKVGAATVSDGKKEKSDKKDNLALLEKYGRAMFSVKRPGAHDESKSGGIAGELVYWRQNSSPTSYGIGLYGNYSQWDMTNISVKGDDLNIVPEVAIASAYDGQWWGQLKARFGYQEATTERKGKSTTRQSGAIAGVYGESHHRLTDSLDFLAIADFWTGVNQKTNNGSGVASRTSLDVSVGLEKKFESVDLRWRNMVGYGYREQGNTDFLFAKSELRKDTKFGTLIAGVQAGNHTIGAFVGISEKGPVERLYADHRADGFNPADSNQEKP